MDYAQALAESAASTGGKGDFRQVAPVASADFDVNYQPINSSYPGMAVQAYTIQSGDTLQSIALTLWGDANLWYLIADANGISGRTQLVAGQILTIPNKVTNFHNTSQTFRPYNPGQAVGDTLPTLPPEPQPPIPSTRSRRAPIPHNPVLYKLRNRIERCFNKLKHFRRFATRYDRLAIHYAAVVHIDAAMIWMR